MLQLSFYLAMIDGEEDQKKFEQLFIIYHSLMLHQAKIILRDDMLAEDALSMAFLYIAKNMHCIGEVPSSRTKALLMLMIKHRALDIARKQQREQGNWVDLIEANDLEAKERTDNLNEYWLDEALERLKWPYQQVILLKYANGYSNREIAQLLGYTVSNVEKIISRGKKKLRRLLEEVQQQ